MTLGPLPHFVWEIIAKCNENNLECFDDLQNMEMRMDKGKLGLTILQLLDIVHFIIDLVMFLKRFF